MNYMAEDNQEPGQLEAGLLEKTDDSVTQWATFYLNQEKYGINVMQVREVLRPTEIAPVPGAPDFVLGIINLRGTVVTVVGTRKRLGLTPKEMDDATRIVIVEWKQQLVGLVVDSVADVMNIRASEIEMAPGVGNDESSKYIYGLSKQDNELLIIMDLDALLTVEQMHAVENF